jgi:hypothetical protein
MKYIGNIVTKSKIEVSSFFNVTSDFNSIDTNTPTLIIGWSYVKELFPEQDILNEKINDNVLWTFSKREKRYKYEKDLTKFIENSIKFINENVNYRFFNYITATEQKRDNFIKYIKNGGLSIYYNSRFAYIYSPADKMTIGVSLIDLSYIGINVKNFLESFNENCNNIITDNLNYIDSESFILIKDNTKVVAYLNYLKNSDIYKKNDYD